MDLILKNGFIVTPCDIYLADLRVKGEKIVAIGQNLDAEGVRIIDVSGKYILPGAVDAHTHLQMPFGGTISSDDYFTGTRAAVCGGVTTIIDYAMQRAGSGIQDAVNERKVLADQKVCVDYGLHCIITDLNGGSLLEEFQTAVDAGTTSFKCFFTYKKQNMMVDDGTFVKILTEAHEAGAMVNLHAESNDLIELNTELLLKEGKTSAWYHYVSRPEYVEADADIRAIHLAKSLKKPLYIVHMATEEGVEAAAKAKLEGDEIYVETCPHYLEFTCDVYKREDGRNFVCSPPMKGQRSKEALWKALNTGVIDTVATDHCPFHSFEKDWGKDDFTKIPNGCGGLEILYPYMLHAANMGKISFSKAVEVCSFNPAKIFGCKEKGSLSIGKDADIVVYDPKLNYVVSSENIHTNCDHSIWEGMTFHGYPSMTFVRGKLLYENGKFLGEPGFGKYIKRSGRRAGSV